MTAPRCVSGSALKATLSATIAEGARGQVSPFFLIETFLIIIHHTPPHDHHSPPHDDDDDDDDDYDDDYDDDTYHEDDNDQDQAVGIGVYIHKVEEHGDAKRR